MSTREWAPRRTQINAHSLEQELALQVRCRVETLPTLAFLKHTQKWLLVRLALGRGRRRVVAGGSLVEGSQRSLRELLNPTPYLAGGDGGGATAGVPPTESAEGHHATAQGTRRAMSVNLPPHLSLRHLRRLRDLLHVCRVDPSPFYYAAHNFPDRTTTWESRQPHQGVRRRIQHGTASGVGTTKWMWADEGGRPPELDPRSASENSARASALASERPSPPFRRHSLIERCALGGRCTSPPCAGPGGQNRRQATHWGRASRRPHSQPAAQGGEYERPPSVCGGSGRDGRDLP